MPMIYLVDTQPKLKVYVCLRDHLQISPEWKIIFNFCFPGNHQKTYDFFIISGGVEVN